MYSAAFVWLGGAFFRTQVLRRSRALAAPLLAVQVRSMAGTGSSSGGGGAESNSSRFAGGGAEVRGHNDIIHAAERVVGGEDGVGQLRPWGQVVPTYAPLVRADPEREQRALVRVRREAER